MASGTIYIHISSSFHLMICLYLCLRVGLATEYEDVVIRPLGIQCPQVQAQSERFIQGVNMLTANDPFHKRIIITSDTAATFDQTPHLWEQLARFRNPNDKEHGKPSGTKKSESSPFFQGFRQQFPNIPTETYSPVVTKRQAKLRKFLVYFQEKTQVSKTGNKVQGKMVNVSAESVSFSPHVLPEKEGNKKQNPHHSTSSSTNDLVRTARNANNHRFQFSEPYATNLALPWSCHAQRYWVDLGPNVFPRYVSDTRCLNNTCWYGHYHCTAHRIEMPVFVQHFGQCQDNRLPAAVRGIFMLSSVEVSGTCVCGRH